MSSTRFQFFFWLVMGTCVGLTFGSVVGNDLVGLSWNALGDALVIAEFSLVVLVFILNCFADKSPLYQDVRGEFLKKVQGPQIWAEL